MYLAEGVFRVVAVVLTSFQVRGLFSGPVGNIYLTGVDVQLR